MNEFEMNEFSKTESLDGAGRTDLYSSWRDSVRDIYSDLNRVYRKEGELIKTELSEKATEVKAGAGSLLSGGVIMLIGAHVLAFSAVFALNLFLPLWASALIVAAVFFVIGYMMINSGKAKMEAQNLVPTHSIDAMKEIKNRFEGRYHEFKRH